MWYQKQCKVSNGAMYHFCYSGTVLPTPGKPCGYSVPPHWARSLKHLPVQQMCSQWTRLTKKLLQLSFGDDGSNLNETYSKGCSSNNHLVRFHHASGVRSPLWVRVLLKPWWPKSFSQFHGFRVWNRFISKERATKIRWATKNTKRVMWDDGTGGKWWETRMAGKVFLNWEWKRTVANVPHETNEDEGEGTNLQRWPIRDTGDRFYTPLGSSPGSPWNSILKDLVVMAALGFNCSSH